MDKKLLDDVSFGIAKDEPIDWRKIKDDDAGDDDDVESADPAVIAILGFDPFAVEADEGEEVAR